MTNVLKYFSVANTPKHIMASCTPIKLFKKNEGHNCVNVFSVIDMKFYGTKIYTRTGDKGTSSLFTGERRPKGDCVFDALGDVDELNCNVGMCREVLKDSWQQENFQEIGDMLEKIQCCLLDIGSCIATPHESASEKMIERTKFDESLIDELEEWIDKFTEELPELTNFILPSGGKSSCSLHICRSVCRRAERKISTVLQSEKVNHSVAKYINRLSDFLFTMARYVALMEGHEERIYKKPKKQSKLSDLDSLNSET